ncbi:MAG: protein-L-isoaspartate O-methyltransferase [Rickettsiales bacterium]|nr:protein-L-isoaspartate O-methyltransferase [Rickettsiales bacterium]|tara:strand:- start:1755 stop:2399 length:645 start_codon:yes stop_codon:yes gene_type:complete
MKKIKRFGKFDLLLDLKKQGVSDIDVLNVIEDVDRSLFIDTNLKEKSNLNVALPIECGQTISQPLIVAYMTQVLEINKRMRVLEIGTGSGYQSCVLSKLSRFVYTIERHSLLQKKAKNLLHNLSINNVFFKHADGGLGWSEQAPFDRIIVTASAPEIPTKLLSQLVDDGIMVIPVGEDNDNQVLKKIIKKGDSFIVKNIMNVRFVPLLEGKVEY